MWNEANVVRVPGHKRRAHPQNYHEEVFDRLRAAIRDKSTQAEKKAALIDELRKLATDIKTPGHRLNKWVTDPDSECG